MEFRKLNLFLKCSLEFGLKRIKGSGINTTECLICSFVYAHPECSQDDVVRALRFDKTTVARALHTLEDKGCVTRARDGDDARRKRLRVTPVGEKTLSDIAGRHDEYFSEVLSCLTETEEAQFEDYCERLLGRAEELHRGDSGTAH